MIETERLILVPADLSMNEILLNNRRAFEQKYQVHLIEGWPNETVYKMFIRIFKENPDTSPWLNWFIIEKKSKTVIGDLGFKGKPSNGQVEIGYSVIESFRRQGYATEALKGLIEFAFLKQVTSIIAATLTSNLPSIKVLEHCGFLKTDAFIEDNKDHYLWKLEMK